MLTIEELIVKDTELVSLTDIHLDDRRRLDIDQLMKEHTYISELHSYGLPVNNKVLLHVTRVVVKLSQQRPLQMNLAKTFRYLTSAA